MTSCFNDLDAHSAGEELRSLRLLDGRGRPSPPEPFPRFAFLGQATGRVKTKVLPWPRFAFGADAATVGEHNVLGDG